MKYILIAAALIALALGGWFFLNNRDTILPATVNQQTSTEVTEESLEADLNTIELEDEVDDLSALEEDLNNL